MKKSICLYTYLFPRYLNDIFGLFVLNRWDYFSKKNPDYLIDAIIPTQLKYRIYKSLNPKSSFPIKRIYILPSSPRIFYPISFLTYFFRMLFIFLRKKPKLVIVEYGFPDAILIYFLSKIIKFRYSIVLRGSDVRISLNKNNFLTRLAIKSYRKACVLLPVSYELKSILVRKIIPEKKIFTVHGSYNPSWEGNSNSDSETDRKSKKVIAMVGRFSYEKRQDLIIQTFNMLNIDYPDLELWLFGDGPRKTELLNSNDNKNIIFFGEISQKKLIQYMKKVAILVHLSESEGFPTIIMEAMVMKIPVIASKIGGIPELIDENSGILVNNKVGKVYNACKKLLVNEGFYRKISEKAFKKVKCFSPDSEMLKLKKILDYLSLY